MLLDMDRGTVSFVKDGDDFNMGRPVVVNMGIAYHHLRRVGRSDAAGRNGLAMYPCFGVKSAGDQMTVRGQKWLSRRGLGHARRVRQAVDAIVAARELRRSLVAGAPPPVSLVEGARRRHRCWRRGRFSSYPSRAGVSCEVDVAHGALQRAAGGVADGFGGLRVGQRVDTPYGEGKVLGSLRADVWYSLDGDDSGAWYWTREELSDLLNSARLRLLEGDGNADADQNDDASGLPQGEGEGEDADAAGSVSSEAAPAAPVGEVSEGAVSDSPVVADVVPTVEPPLAAADDSVNVRDASSAASARADTNAKETGAMAAAATGDPATRASPQEFAALATEGWGSLALDEVLVRVANVVAGRRGVPTSHLSAGELAAAAEAAGPGVGGSALAGMGADKLGARLLLLLELNARLALALPLLDLALDSRAPLAVTKGDLRRAEVAPGVSIGIRSPSGRAVADLRGLLFTQTKVGFLRTRWRCCSY